MGSCPDNLKSGLLFDEKTFSEFRGDGETRKPPETEAQRRLCEIQGMEERDFKNLRLKLNGGKTLTASEAKRLERSRKKFEQISGLDLPEHVDTV